MVFITLGNISNYVRNTLTKIRLQYRALLQKKSDTERNEKNE